MSLTLADIRDTPECGNVTGPYAARGFVRDAAEVGRVWGSFRRSMFRREGGDVFGYMYAINLYISLPPPLRKQGF